MTLPSPYRVRRSIFSSGFSLALVMSGLTSISHAGLPSSRWTWMNGSNLGNQSAVYGTQGVPSPANNPEAQSGSSTWKDAQGNLWLYGKADLWKYNVSVGQWAWIKGNSNSVDPHSVYGSKGVPSSFNHPGDRYRAVSWTDAQGRFWLFGGDGYTASGGSAGLNDLWMYDPNPGSAYSGKWTWMHGTNERNHEGVYGSQGSAAPSNIPANRAGAVSWADGAGNLWLFGGLEYPFVGSFFYKLNDLWKYDISTNRWTWVKGGTNTGGVGTYGIMGSGTSTTRPGGRFLAQGWTDLQGRLWLYGGYGVATSSTEGSLNDLWCFDPATNIWTWIKGSNALNQNGSFGLVVDPVLSNRPGGLTEAITWTDPQGDFWLYGGTGYSTGGNVGELSALWRYNVGSNIWTWMNGTQSVGVAPVFGTIGSASSDNLNTPGGLHAAAAWAGNSNSLWLFGGVSYNPSTGDTGYSSLWQLATNSGITVSSSGSNHANNGTVNFGSKIIGLSVTRTFTILNSTFSTLSSLNVSLEATQGGNYTITKLPATSLTAGQSTTFDITFIPNSTGTAIAKINVTSTGTPYLLIATGTGTLPAVSLTAAPGWVWEDGGAPITFTFTRNGGTANPLTVNFTVSGNATLDTDYFVSDADTFTASAGSVIIPAGSASATLKIVPISDSTTEIAENVQLNLNSFGQYNVGTPNLANGVIASEELLPGARDYNFFPEIVGGPVATTALQPDGKLVIGGGFTSVNGMPRINLARLNPDGTLDTNFSATIHPDFFVTGILIQPDGRILIKGGATGITRLLSDGSPDPFFTSPFSISNIAALAQQSDGKIIIGGGFTMVGSETRNHIARLNTDGTLDSTFDPGLGADNWVECLATQPDGMILVGGQFDNFNGQPHKGIIRLDPSGTPDPTFITGSGITGGSYTSIVCFAIQPDGRIVFGGEFTAYNGQSRSRVARINNDGTLDPNFNAPAMNDRVNALALQTDSKIILGGYFSHTDSHSSPYISRLNPDGTFDSTLQIELGPNYGIYGLTILANGHLLVSGYPNTQDPLHSSISKRTNGPATQALAPASGSVAQWQRTGTGPELSRMTFDLSTDGGINWTPLGAGVRITDGWQVNGQALPITGHLRARGFAIGSYSSATSSIIEQVQPFTRAPEIVVEDINSVSLTDGVSIFDFGLQPCPQLIIEPGSRGFTIRNIGNADLNNFSVVIDGDHAGDFYFNGPLPYNLPLAPGAVRNLMFTFTPQALGTRNAMLHIGSNDADENPFDIVFTGLGATAKEVWRHTNFGSIANSGPGADISDPDGDGNNNQFEFLAGLNPNDINARFQVHLEAVPGAPNQRKILFTPLPLSLAGNLNIFIKYSTTLRNDDWHPLSTGLIDTSGPEWFVIDTAAGSSMKFYRIELSVP